jgi:hypothetical protein
MSKPLDFPIPYPGQQPDDDLATILSMLNLVDLIFENNETINSATAQNMRMVLLSSISMLEQLYVFLNDLDLPNSSEK